MSNWQYIGLMRKEFGGEWLLKTQFFKPKGRTKTRDLTLSIIFIKYVRST